MSFERSVQILELVLERLGFSGIHAVVLQRNVSIFNTKRKGDETYFGE